MEDKFFSRIAEECPVILDTLKQKPSVEVGGEFPEGYFEELVAEGGAA